MAIPRTFISSTCYDLKYIRENLKYFIRMLGYEPVLSEEGSIFYDPAKHTHDACLVEVPSCQLFVLIIGGRYGTQHKTLDGSITNEEYRAAIKHRIPVFALVEAATYSDFDVYMRNRVNADVDETKIYYPAADDTRIFEFIEEVRGQVSNNAIAPFRDFADIESYLRQQWAGMMFAFLSRKNEEERMADTMAELVKMNERVEFLSSQILRSVGSAESKLFVQLYDQMLDNSATNTLISTGHKPHPLAVLQSATLSECAAMLGKPFKVIKNADFLTSGNGEIDNNHLKHQEAKYTKMRNMMLETVRHYGISVEQLAKADQIGSS